MTRRPVSTSLIALCVVIFNLQMAAAAGTIERVPTPDASPRFSVDVSTEFNDADQTAAITFDNQSGRDLTAWQIEVTLRFEDGDEFAVPVSSDAMLMIAPATRPRVWVESGDRKSITNEIARGRSGPFADPPVEARLRAALYADGSYEGDRAFVERVVVERVAVAAQLRADIRALEAEVARAGAATVLPADDVPARPVVVDGEVDQDAHFAARAHRNVIMREVDKARTQPDLDLRRSQIEGLLELLHASLEALESAAPLRFESPRLDRVMQATRHPEGTQR